MPLLTEFQAELVGWSGTLLWMFFTGFATFDAVPLWMLNRQLYSYAINDPDTSALERIGAAGDLRRSRNFLIGFALSFVVGLAGFALRFFFPPEPDTSLLSAVLLYILVAHMFFMWRAKHTDRVTAKQQERYIREHPEEMPHAL